MRKEFIDKVIDCMGCDTRNYRYIYRTKDIYDAADGCFKLREEIVRFPLNGLNTTEILDPDNWVVVWTRDIVKEV